MAREIETASQRMRKRGLNAKIASSLDTPKTNVLPRAVEEKTRHRTGGKKSLGRTKTRKARRQLQMQLLRSPLRVRIIRFSQTMLMTSPLLAPRTFTKK